MSKDAFAGPHRPPHRNSRTGASGSGRPRNVGLSVGKVRAATPSAAAYRQLGVLSRSVTNAD